MATSPHTVAPRQRATPIPALLTAGGLAAAFGAAACCGLPFVLAGLGLGSAWLGGIALAAAPHRLLVVGVAALLIAAGGAALWEQSHRARSCSLEGVCAQPATRRLIMTALLAALVLLALGFFYG